MLDKTTLRHRELQSLQPGLLTWKGSLAKTSSRLSRRVQQPKLLRASPLYEANLVDSRAALSDIGGVCRKHATTGNESRPGMFR
jgi:hypothetical protein